MPRYFLHLRRGEEAFLDAEGCEFADLEALRRAALHDARDTMSWDIKAGRLDLRFRIDAEDADGRLVLSLGFDEAVEILVVEDEQGTAERALTSGRRAEPSSTA